MAELKPVEMHLEAWAVRKVKRGRGVRSVAVELRYRVDAAVMTFRIPWTALISVPAWWRVQEKVAAAFRNSSDVRAYPVAWRGTLRRDFVAVCEYVVQTRREYGSGAEVRDANTPA